MFLKRVCFRIFEVLFNTINQSNHKAPQIYQKYLKLKQQCQKILGDNIEDKSFQLLSNITDFIYEKLNILIWCLKGITSNLENGNFNEMEKLQEQQCSS